MYTEEDIKLFWEAYQKIFWDELYYDEEPSFDEEWDREMNDFDVWERSL